MMKQIPILEEYQASRALLISSFHAMDKRGQKQAQRSLFPSQYGVGRAVSMEEHEKGMQKLKKIFK